jgi:hypothetical protein
MEDMMNEKSCELVSYIAPSAPATRRAARGDEPFLRPEIGFTPAWFADAAEIDFDESWHRDPEYRKSTILKMQNVLQERFPGIPIGGGPNFEMLDLLTGTFGACTVSAMYGVPIRFDARGWPVNEHAYLSESEIDALQPPNLDENSFFQDLLAQVDWIEKDQGRVEGFINWQGVLNNAQRLRGQELFMDMIVAPDRARHLFDCVCTTMIDASKRLHARQQQSGVDVRFFTVSNCLVNMLSAELYHDFLLPFDQRIAKEFGCIGVHNCAWNADPYLDSYAEIPHVGYIDMGMDSDLTKARELFPNARRAIMYTPMDVANKSLAEIEQDILKIAQNYGPCDIVAADNDVGVPDERILDFYRIC